MISRHRPWCTPIVRPVFVAYSLACCSLSSRLCLSFCYSLVLAMSTFTSSFHLHSTIFFYWLSTHLVCCSCSSYRSTSIIINDVFELVVLILMTIAVICAYMQTVKLDVNHHPLSKLDDVLLFVAIPAFFLETIFSMLPAVVNGSYLNIARSLLQISQVLIQTPFIIDGLRRCSNAAELRKSKPGRELVIFLTIANVSLWVFYTFSVKTAYTGDERWDIIMWYFFFCVLEFYWWLLFLNTFADTNSMVTFCGIFSIISRCRWLCSIVSMRLSVWSTFGGIRMSQHRWNIDCIHRLLKISTQSCTNMKLNLFVCFNRNFVWIILIVTHFW